MDVCIFVYDGVTALDAVGPYESIRRLPGVSTAFVAPRQTPVKVEGQALRIEPRQSIDDVDSVDVLIVPGGGADGLRAMVGNERVRTWISDIHANTRWTASVCTGALILGAAGLIDGLSVATHWRAQSYLAHFGAGYSGERITEHDKLITSAGVAAGMDLGLRLCELMAGTEAAQAAQLSMEYDPAPPFDAGSPDRAPAHIVELALGGFGG